MSNNPLSVIGNQLPDNKLYKNRFEIPSSSSNRLYVVAQNKQTGVWSCSCPGWIRHRHCKHLKTLMPMLLEVDNNNTMRLSQ